MRTGIKHIWFDFSDTIGRINTPVADAAVLEAFAEVTKRKQSPELAEEVKVLRQQHGSTTAIFTSLGMPATFLVDRLGRIDPQVLYSLTDPNIPRVLQELNQILPISIFSNNRLDTILPALGVSPQWFTHILGPDRVARPKPFPDGFEMMIRLSGVAAGEILFIGDEVKKDLLPARALGIRTGLLWSVSDEADYCFRDFQDILEKFQ
jgi:HAD superfamily hydrolase (TIGR01549 family)